MDRLDLLNAMVVAGVNALVIVGCLIIWAFIIGAVQW